ncbi:hypothetical protein B0H14DRAFT_949022 [Mycena olivaceomarginata]|nr:hypothetical protein B0H14DRAFT_949022 [Mycena olivaceomarginata]
MSVVVATEAEAPHQIPAVAEVYNGDLSDIKTEAVGEKQSVDTQNGESLQSSVKDASPESATESKVDETQSFVGSQEHPVAGQTEPSTNITNVSSLDHATADLTLAQPENPELNVKEDADEALEANSAPPSSAAVPLDENDASTISREINDPIPVTAEVPVDGGVSAAASLSDDDDEAVASGSFILENAEPIVVEIPSIKTEDLTDVRAFLVQSSPAHRLVTGCVWISTCLRG